MIEAGIFDLGKVVVHSDDQVLLEDIRQVLGLNDTQIKQVASDFGNTIGTGQISEDEYWETFLKSQGIQKTAPQDLLARSFRRDFKFIDGTIELIKDLKIKGLRLAALSNTIPAHVNVLREEGTFEYFDELVLSCEVGLRKPDPRIYELALEKLGLEPKQTFFTDDREENIRAAEKLGIEVVLFENPNQLREDLNKFGLVI